MSEYSGKCDLFDHLAMIDVDGEWTEEKAFEKFKEQHKGRIFQYKRIILTKDNVDYWINQTKTDEFSKLTRDKVKGFNYWDKNYKTLKSLNTKGFYATVEIKLTNLLDFVQYYPYIVAFSCGDVIEIGSESYVDRQIREREQWKLLPQEEKEDSIAFYEKLKTRLMDHYFELKEMKQ